MVVVTVLCLGPRSSGKSILLNVLRSNLENGRVQLEDRSANTLLLKTAPTVGVNNFAFALSDRPNKYLQIGHTLLPSRLTEYDLKELGGEIAPLWTSYIKQHLSLGARFGVIFVLDSSGGCEVGAFMVNLIEVLESILRSDSKTSLLLVFSKIDLLSSSCFLSDNEPFDRHNLDEIKRLLRVCHLREWCKAKIEITEVEYSAMNGQGLPEIRNWLQTLH